MDWSILAGSLGLFGFLFLLFVRFVPSVAISEVKSLRTSSSRTLRLGVAMRDRTWSAGAYLAEFIRRGVDEAVRELSDARIHAARDVFARPGRVAAFVEATRRCRWSCSSPDSVAGSRAT